VALEILLHLPICDQSAADARTSTIKRLRILLPLASYKFVFWTIEQDERRDNDGREINL